MVRIWARSHLQPSPHRDPAPRRSIAGVCEPWRAEAGAGGWSAHGLCAATVEPVVRQHAVSVLPSALPSTGEVPVPAWVWSREARRALAGARVGAPTRRSSFPGGGNKKLIGARRLGSGCGGVTRTPRVRGRRPRTVARSQADEDCTRTPRWRARTRTALSRRERVVSAFGKKNGKSTTWKPRTLRGSVGSRPTRGQRSACTSSPRRARTARWKGAG